MERVQIGEVKEKNGKGIGYVAEGGKDGIALARVDSRRGESKLLLANEPGENRVSDGFNTESN